MDAGASCEATSAGPLLAVELPPLVAEVLEDADRARGSRD